MVTPDEAKGGVGCLRSGDTPSGDERAGALPVGGVSKAVRGGVPFGRPFRVTRGVKGLAERVVPPTAIVPRLVPLRVMGEG